MQVPRTKAKGSSEHCVEPGPFDVLCGRGKGFANHHGNLLFRRLVSHHRQRYLAASKPEKRLIVLEIIGIVHTSGSRFLCNNSGLYHLAEDAFVRKKVAHAFRDGFPTSTKKKTLASPESKMNNCLKKDSICDSNGGESSAKNLLVGSIQEQKAFQEEAATEYDGDDNNSKSSTCSCLSVQKESLKHTLRGSSEKEHLIDSGCDEIVKELKSFSFNDPVQEEIQTFLREQQQKGFVNLLREDNSRST